MKKIESVIEFLGRSSQIRKDFGSVITNIYPNKALYLKVIEDGRMEAHEDSDCFLAFESAQGFKRVYFAAPKAERILSILTDLSKSFPEPLVLEHIIREGKDVRLGEPSQVLKRMSHQGILNPDKRGASNKAVPFFTRDAQPKDIDVLKEIFAHHFNPLSERIPDETELLGLMEKRGVKVAVCNGSIVGFIIFDKEGSNLHLRYWWTSPGHRGVGIGSLLMEHFIEAARGTARQFLWVFDDNENAIKRYRHYGFEFDGTEDDIYIFEN